MVPFNVLKGSGELRINTLEKERKKERREREERTKGRGERKGEEEGKMGEGGIHVFVYHIGFFLGKYPKENKGKKEEREKGGGRGRREGRGRSEGRRREEEKSSYLLKQEQAKCNNISIRIDLKK